MKTHKNRIKYICKFCGKIICSRPFPTHQVSWFNMKFVPLTEKQSLLRNNAYLKDKSIAHTIICRKYKEARTTARTDSDVVNIIYY